jgi:hypothetical protein
VFDTVMTHFDDLYIQLNIQMKRIAQIQQQGDLLIAQSRKDKPSEPAASFSAKSSRHLGRESTSDGWPGSKAICFVFWGMHRKGNHVSRTNEI